jgi:transcription-repair coupling factor (superfamily II helicase)
MDAEELHRSLTERSRPLRLLRVQGAAGAYLVARQLALQPGPALWIAPDRERAERALQDLRTFEAPQPWLFPAYDTPPFDRFSPHPEIEAQRMSALYRLLSAQPGSGWIAVTTWAALMRKVLARDQLRGRVTHLERGLSVDRDALLRSLVAAGYHRASLVEERGEVALRGAILDLFPPQLERPVRLEVDYDEIVAIREFDPATQRSDRELRSVVAIPPRAVRAPSDPEILLARARHLGREFGLPESSIYQVAEALAHRRLPPAPESLEALLQGPLESAFDYLPEAMLLVVDDPEAAASERQRFAVEVSSGSERAAQQDRMVNAPSDLYLDASEAWAAVMQRRPLLLDGLGSADPGAGEDALAVDARDHAELRREIADRVGSGHALEPLMGRLAQWKADGRSVRLLCPSLSSAERLADILREYGHALPSATRPQQAIAPGTLRLEIGSASSGFELPHEGLVVVTEQDLFGARLRRRPVRATRAGQAIDRLAQVQEGELLVHAEHGIGRYGGLVQLPVGGARQEFLLILFEGADKLYVPVSRLDRVQRYSGADDSTPRLDKLGGGVWQRTKGRVKKAVVDMARELIAVVAAREVLEGTAYPAPDADYEEFEARFPYEDTPDQRKATEDVLADLQRTRPMDRLVCGDVGFGKTEVACRAAYRVLSAGRQVAFLVPTTVLCRQHAATLRARFVGTPVEVRTLSRLESPKEVKATRDGLASGQVDLVVGTHRLLSKDVQFRNLGLVIVDEEHRFGVAHKERLKTMRKLVDVLTLSATPIPRTLQLSLTGMRDLSVILTPPPDRVAIRSHVCRFADEVVQEAISRELRRGGQVFFVHNRVETIEEFASYVRSIVPEASVGVGHGQMAPQQLERVMLAFVERKFDVLVCTAIIESGLDIPNANTILIHRADHFGLAQLYQLRGRVGRSDRRAYAYFLLPPEGQMTTEARRRIEAIQDLSELGAGFRLASEDLEIRGAGNLLGPEQSGQIAAVGYDLYMEMLEEAVSELRGQAIERDVDPEIRLPVAALLPETYVEDVSQRLMLYKQLSGARDDAELREILDDLLDRFGPLPPEARNLAELIRLKIRCRQLRIHGIETARGELVVKADAKSRIDAARLLKLITQPNAPWRVTPDQRIRLRLRKLEDALPESFSLLDLLAGEGEGARATL